MYNITGQVYNKTPDIIKTGQMYNRTGQMYTIIYMLHDYLFPCNLLYFSPPPFPFPLLNAVFVIVFLIVITVLYRTFPVKCN